MRYDGILSSVLLFNSPYLHGNWKTVLVTNNEWFTRVVNVIAIKKGKR